jgi:carbonic anhydrase
MRHFILLTFLSLLCSSAFGQGNETRTSRVLTASDQGLLTPQSVQQIMQEGNDRFLANALTSRDHSSMVRDAVTGQFPKAMVLSCIDSRIPVEDVFDLGIGDVFVARVAGNFSNTDILGSMEYATAVSGSKLVVVLGHEECGAIKSAIDNAQLGNITAMLENIKPAVESLADYAGEKSSKNPDYVHRVAVRNVELTLDNIRENSEVLRELEEQGKIMIVGAMYDMHSGAIHFLEP